MGCDAKERKTFANISRLARMAKQITGFQQTIYKESGKETYAFCGTDTFTEEKGEPVAYV